MDLSLGTKVCEHGYRIGRLAGIEADSRTRVVRTIVISGDGTVGPHAERRPLAAVPADHFDGDIMLSASRAAEERFAPYEVLMLTDATRVVRGGHQIGRLSGVELSPTGEIMAIVGRQHWWSRRFRLETPGLDFSVAGEVRVGAATSRAA